MLMVCLPDNEYEGQCNINGIACDFVVAVVEPITNPPTALFSFRPAGSSQPWDSRKILETTQEPGSNLVNLFCANSVDDGVPNIIITGSPSGEPITSVHTHDERGFPNNFVDFTIGKKPE